MNTDRQGRNQKESHRRDAEPQTQRSSLGAHASSVPRVSDTGTQDACAPRSPRRKIRLERILLLICVHPCSSVVPFFAVCAGGLASKQEVYGIAKERILESRTHRS